MADQASTADKFFELVNGYQRTAALRAAIELGLFTAIADGRNDVDAICRQCDTSPRGTRILCDYLVVLGLLTKEGTAYRLTPYAELHLDHRSPWFLGESVQFLASPTLMASFEELAARVRQGGAAPSADVLAPDHPVWLQYAQAMRPLAARAVEAVVELVTAEQNGPMLVLDIAAGHGMFGIAIAAKRHDAQIVAVDWPGVLQAAVANARAVGVEKRYKTIGGDALKVAFGTGYHLALVTNFLHHFDRKTCVGLLEKVRDALADDGRLVILEFAPNDDRVSPPGAAGFALTMLAITTAGDAHPASEIIDMAAVAGFADITTHPFPAPQTIFLARKPIAAPSRLR